MPTGLQARVTGGVLCCLSLFSQRPFPSYTIALTLALSISALCQMSSIRTALLLLFVLSTVRENVTHAAPSVPMGNVTAASVLTSAASFSSTVLTSAPLPVLLLESDSSVAQLLSSSSSRPSSGVAPLLLTALSPPMVATVQGLCRGYTLPGSERYCVKPGGAADITVTASIHRAAGSPWPAMAALSALNLRLRIDSLHPLQLSPAVLLPMWSSVSPPPASSHVVAVPFRGVLSVPSSRVGIFDLLFVTASSQYVVPLGEVNSTVAVEVAKQSDTPTALSQPLCHSCWCHSLCRLCGWLPRFVCARGDMQRWRVRQW